MTDQQMSQSQCQAVLRDVSLFLDNELDPVRRAIVEQHLIDCPPCLDETDVGHRLKMLLHKKCGGDTAPQLLRERLVAALSVQMSVFEGGAGDEATITKTVSVQTLAVQTLTVPSAAVGGTEAGSSQP